MNVSTPTSRITRFLGLTGSLALAAGLLSSCSSAVAPNNTTTVNAQTATVPVLITDAPSDQLAAFTLTLNSITLTDSAGKTASILSTPHHHRNLPSQRHPGAAGHRQHPRGHVRHRHHRLLQPADHLH